MNSDRRLTKAERDRLNDYLDHVNPGMRIGKTIGYVKAHELLKPLRIVHDDDYRSLVHGVEPVSAFVVRHPTWMHDDLLGMSIRIEERLRREPDLTCATDDLLTEFGGQDPMSGAAWTVKRALWALRDQGRVAWVDGSFAQVRLTTGAQVGAGTFRKFHPTERGLSDGTQP